MPIYEYECGSCGKFEVLQKITEEPLKDCQTCGKPVHRLVSLSSFALVGGGWYKDLYSSTSTTASSGVGTQHDAPVAASSASSSSSDSKSGDSKPAAKAEGKSEKSTTAAA